MSRTDLSPRFGAPSPVGEYGGFSSRLLYLLLSLQVDLTLYSAAAVSTILGSIQALTSRAFRFVAGMKGKDMTPTCSLPSGSLVARVSAPSRESKENATPMEDFRPPLL